MCKVQKSKSILEMSLNGFEQVIDIVMITACTNLYSRLKDIFFSSYDEII